MFAVGFKTIGKTNESLGYKVCRGVMFVIYIELRKFILFYALPEYHFILFVSVKIIAM